MRFCFQVLSSVLLLAVQTAGDQGDNQAANYNYNDGDYYNANDYDNGNDGNDGNDYNDGYDYNDANAGNDGNDYDVNDYSDYQGYSEYSANNGNDNGYVDYDNGYDAYDYDEDGDGMGGAWINGVYRPFCAEDQNAYEQQQQQQEAEDEVECIQYNKYIPSENCEHGVITVKSISIACDSPYQFYYGNGAHQNSQLCDYGDKATITVFFKNAYNLPSNKAIYMTMGVYARKDNLELVYAARNVKLCDELVGHECTAAGNYAFNFQATFDYVYGDRSQFVPVVEMGFSTNPDDGYDLGGVNIDCVFDNSYRPYNPWLDRSTTWGAGAGFAANYGLLIGVLLLLVAFGLYAYKHYANDIEWKGVDWPFGNKQPMEEGLMISPSGSVAES